MDQSAEGCSTSCIVRNGWGNKGAVGTLYLVSGLYLHPLLCNSVTIYVVQQWPGLKNKVSKTKSGFPSRDSFNLVSISDVPESGHKIRKVGAFSQEDECHIRMAEKYCGTALLSTVELTLSRKLIYVLFLWLSGKIMGSREYKSCKTSLFCSCIPQPHSYKVWLITGYKKLFISWKIWVLKRRSISCMCSHLTVCFSYLATKRSGAVVGLLVAKF